jgi:hypothetical protein
MAASSSAGGFQAKACIFDMDGLLVGGSHYD